MPLIPVCDDAMAQYESLLLRREAVRKEAAQWQRAFTREFGGLLLASFRAKVECVKLKKAISLCVAQANRDEKIDAAGVQLEVARQMTAYRLQLDEMLAENERCKNWKPIDEADVARIKKIYFALAKRLHPDLNPAVQKNARLQELWQQATAAYRGNDLKSLEEIEVLSQSALTSVSVGKIVVPDIKKKIAALEEEIAKIVSEEPYAHKILLSDAQMREAKKADLRHEIEEYEVYAVQLRERLSQFLSEEEMP